MSASMLVRHPRVQTIAFTGSLQVGLEIVRAAADTAPEQKHIKRVIAELGGKNCVIVDADADLDEAVPAIVSSAFVYAGQKCSAAARVARSRGDLRPVDRADRRCRPGARRGPGQPAGHRGAAGDRARGPGARRPLRRARRAATARSSPRPRWSPNAAGSARPPSPPTCHRIAGARRGDLRAAAGDRAGPRRRARLRRSSTSLPFALTGGLFARDPSTVRYVRERTPGGQSVREPRDHGRDGRPPAVRRQPPVGHRGEGRRPGLPAPVRRAARA